MPKLLAIVAVNPGDRVRCQQPSCGHSVYQRIHVVEDAGQLLVLGSTCYAKRYGSDDALGTPSHGGGDGRKLTDAERQLLVDNTAALLSHFESQRRETQAKRLERLPVVYAEAHQSQRPTTQTSAPAPADPPRQSAKGSRLGWMKPLTSMAYFHLRDGTGWLRVQHTDGRHILVPWPQFEGWDEALPAFIGPPLPEVGGYCVQDLASTVRYLREHEEWEIVSGVWQEIVGAIARYQISSAEYPDSR